MVNMLTLEACSLNLSKAAQPFSDSYVSTLSSDSNDSTDSIDSRNSGESTPKSLFDEVMRGRMTSTTDSAPALKGETVSIGQVQSMQVPEDWVKRTGIGLLAGAGLSEFHPAGNSDVRLNSFYRGFRIGADAANAFRKCLEQTPHLIEKGSEELMGLSEALGDKARNFNIGKAFTEVLNGKKVLVVEGSYKDAEHTTAQTRYVDSDGTGSAIQEITYSAPGALFKAYKAAAEGALKSIIWK